MYNFEHILQQLEAKTADELEEQHLDFKEWNSQKKSDAIALLIEMAVCMGNGGGGTVIFGVKDKVKGRSKAIIGVPNDIDIDRLKQTILDSTDPPIIPIFKELVVSEGTGRLLVMEIFKRSPLYTTTSGKGKIRIGKDCRPLTASLILQNLVPREEDIGKRTEEIERRLEFRTELKRDNNNLKLVLFFKNNSSNPIQILFYRIQITKADKIIHSTGFINRIPVFHTSGRVIYPSDKEQEHEFFDWVNSSEWNILQKGEYQIQTEVIYNVNGNEDILSYPVILNF
jgi:hypothetical protein